MEFLIAIIALILAISAKSEVTKLKEENRSLRQLIQSLLPNAPKEPPQSTETVTRTQPVPLPSPPIQPPSHTKPKPSPAKNWENIFGKNIIGVVAVLLMFVGVFAFGTLVITSMSNIIKVIGSFLLSAGVLIAGVLIHKKKPSTFSTCVTGCGIGMLYISIFLTHLHYHLINDITTFVLIFVWATAVALLSRKLKMPALSYLALAGCIISSLLSQTYILKQEMFIEITMYHLLTFVLLIFANKDNHVLFKISSYSSIALNAILSTLITIANASDAPNWLYLCFILGIYNLAICILVHNDKRGDIAGNSVLAMLAHSASLLLTFFIPLSQLIRNAWMSLKGDFATNIEYSQLVSWRSICFFAITIGILALTYAAHHLLTKDTNKRTGMFILTEALMACITLFTPIQLADGTRFGFLMLLPVANLVISCLLKDAYAQKSIRITGFVFLLIDVITSHIAMPHFEWFNIVYSLGLLTLSFLYMKTMFQHPLKFPFLQSMILILHTMVACFHAVPDEHYNLVLIALVLANMALSIISEWKQSAHPASNVLQEIGDSIFAFVLFFVIKATCDTNAITSFILSILLIPFVLVRVRRIIVHKNAFMSVWYGIKFAFYSFATISTFTNITDQQFIVSVFFMLVAVACIAFGFWKDVKPLRIYGLALILASVGKMVIVDVWDQESIIRVICLIGGAMICFGISALYNKIEQRNKINS